ncbi:hypothetical protein KUTeg_024426 [Tegillarca granosa]|uniref:Receptor ligand binding region domain-containing protein n=1 Tax=Tegillarca granosa TaxID=220873 RepID=A0ABQ9E320_TEGGR|nr:hypothetical protein KUTeg_024426 [Tegillarca granosa]
MEKTIVLCKQMSHGVFLFFGMSSIRSMDIVRSYCKRFHMPYISPSLSDVSVHMDPEGFQIHMKPPYTEALVEMIRHYEWHSVHYLYDSEEVTMRF